MNERRMSRRRCDAAQRGERLRAGRRRAMSITRPCASGLERATETYRAKLTKRDDRAREKTCCAALTRCAGSCARHPAPRARSSRCCRTLHKSTRKAHSPSHAAPHKARPPLMPGRRGSNFIRPPPRHVSLGCASAPLHRCSSAKCSQAHAKISEW